MVSGLLMLPLLFWGCMLDPAKGIDTPQIRVRQYHKGPSPELQHWIIYIQYLHNEGHWDEAQKALLLAEKLAQSDPWFYSFWGDLAFENGKKKEAKKHWKKSIKLFGMDHQSKRRELHKKLRLIQG